MLRRYLILVIVVFLVTFFSNVFCFGGQCYFYSEKVAVGGSVSAFHDINLYEGLLPIFKYRKSKTKWYLCGRFSESVMAYIYLFDKDTRDLFLSKKRYKSMGNDMSYPFVLQSGDEAIYMYESPDFSGDSVAVVAPICEEGSTRE